MISLAAAIALAMAPLQATATWGSHFNMGIYAAGTDKSLSPKGGWLSLQCNADSGKAWIYAEIMGQPAVGATRLALRVTGGSGARDYGFATRDDGSVEVGAKDRQFVALWRALRGGDSVTLRFADGRSWSVSLKGAAEVFGRGGCV